MIELLIYITAMAITPGPNTILSMANAASAGLKKGIRLNIGMLCGITAVTAIAFAAAEFLYMAIPQAELIMKWAAFLYLVFLALRMLRKAEIKEDKRSASFVEGMLLQLINIKVYLLALTAISAYIVPMTPSLVTRMAISLLIPLICFICGLVWAVGGSLLKNIYASHSRLISFLFALSLLWCAVRIIL